jgi:hypothetical protein
MICKMGTKPLIIEALSRVKPFICLGSQLLPFYFFFQKIIFRRKTAVALATVVNPEAIIANQKRSGESGHLFRLVSAKLSFK